MIDLNIGYKRFGVDGFRCDAAGMFHTFRNQTVDSLSYSNQSMLAKVKRKIPFDGDLMNYAWLMHDVQDVFVNDMMRHACCCKWMGSTSAQFSGKNEITFVQSVELLNIAS